MWVHGDLWKPELVPEAGVEPARQSPAEGF